MKVKSMKCVAHVLEAIEEYRQVACVESRELDLACLLAKLCSVKSKSIDESERGLLNELVVELIDSEESFANKLDYHEPKLLLELAKKMFIENTNLERLVE